ncbi:hypothetical protein BJF87_15160 [Gordonia sp. CNJ-863]|uniref:DUF5994 family protein n=1 Tax=Gordonia sp. CNJ-863 TaxID=1904963 RepID=UPI000965B1F9|nr:DUF5994 family protein [Gordonia sp. CNJ-863]OLT51770.1 hypothetical protein BJF87_15160 [Gordonia sp. CNJ-863]
MNAPTTHPPRQLRLRLKPADSVRGSVDGAWWPRSRDLATELPDIAQALDTRLPRLERVGYRIADWDAAPDRKIAVDGRSVHLEGFTTWPPGVVRFSCPSGTLTLAVLGPDTDSDAAHETMMRAAERTNTQSAETLIASAAAVDGHRTGHAPAAWDTHEKPAPIG